METSSLILEDKTRTETPKCPVCGKPTVIIDDHYHCGRVVLLSEIGDHYLGFRNLPEQLPKKGCPICGRTMVSIGRWKALFTKKEDGLDRMHCDQSDHYCYVTKRWYMENRC